MAGPLPLWTCATHHPAFRCGGWASIRVSNGVASGIAGGERNTTARRMALAGLAAGLSDLAADKTPMIRIHTTNPELAALGDVLADLGTGGDEPEDDLDLWARIITASKGRRLELVRVPLAPDTPAAFVTAWADLARDKAKASGSFTAAIPRTNLAKVAGLGTG